MHVHYPALRCSACTLSFLPRTVCTRRRIVAGPQANSLLNTMFMHGLPPVVAKLSERRSSRRRTAITCPMTRPRLRHPAPGDLTLQEACPTLPLAAQRPLLGRPAAMAERRELRMCTLRQHLAAPPLSIIITRDLAARVLTQTSVAMVVASKGCSPPLARDSSVCMRFAGGASSSSNPGLA